jgi:hypothetical protein
MSAPLQCHCELTDASPGYIAERRVYREELPA